MVVVVVVVGVVSVFLGWLAVGVAGVVSIVISLIVISHRRRRRCYHRSNGPPARGRSLLLLPATSKRPRPRAVPLRVPTRPCGISYFAAKKSVVVIITHRFRTTVYKEDKDSNSELVVLSFFFLFRLSFPHYRVPCLDEDGRVGLPLVAAAVPKPETDTELTHS